MKTRIPENKLYDDLRNFIEDFKSSGRRGALIPVLHRTQNLFGYIPEAAIELICIELDLSRSQVWGVISFYNFFSTTPKGKYEINVCLGTACHVKGAQRLVDLLEEELGISLGETTEDGLFTLTAARCFGACGLAPALMVNDEVHGRVTTNMLNKIVRDILKKEGK